MISAATLLPALALLLGMAMPAARALDADPVIYVVTYLEVQPGAAKRAAALLHDYCALSRKEAGNLEAAAAAEIGRGNRLVLLETWKEEAAFDAHNQGAAASRLGDGLKPIALGPADRRVARGLSTAPAAALQRGALAVVTHVDVTPPNQAKAEALLKQLAEASRKDAGNQRYDVGQQLNRGNHFAVIAVWQSTAALEAHDMAAHTRQFRDGIGPLLGALYDERIYRPLE